MSKKCTVNNEKKKLKKSEKLKFIEQNSKNKKNILG